MQPLRLLELLLLHQLWLLFTLRALDDLLDVDLVYLAIEVVYQVPLVVDRP